MTLTCSGRAASTRTRCTVVSPFAPSTARATDSHSSGSSTSSASGRAGSTSTRDAAADDAARVAERDQLGRERLDLDAAEVDLGVRGGALRRQRRLGVDVEAIEQAAVDGDAGQPARADARRRQREVPGAELHAADHHLRQVDVAGQLGAIGPPADVQLRAGEAADRHVGGRDAGQARERQLVEHDVEIQILVGEGDLAVDVDARRPPCV